MLNFLRRIEKVKVNPEVVIILGIGNGATLASWLYKFPINTGPFNLALGLSAYAYIGWKKQPHRNFRLRKLEIEPRKLAFAASVGAGLALPPIIFLFFR